MESISIADSRLGTSICCSTTDNDTHSVENLINSKNATHGFMTVYYVRPPVTVTLHLPMPLQLISLEWDCQVGSQLALSHEVWASSSKSTNCGVNCKLSKRGASDPPTVFQKIGGGFSQNGKIKFSNKRFSSEGYRLACPADQSVLNAAWCVAIKIVRTRASDIPCIKNLRILVRKSRDSSEFKQLLEKVKQIEDLTQSASSTVSFFGSPEEEDDKISDMHTTDTVVLNDEDDKLDIPPDYLDEITHEMMTMPMTLPSGKTVDRSTVEKCEKSQMMWGGPSRDPFTGQIYTKTVRPVFDSALKSRIDRFLLDHGSQGDELRNVGRTLGSADKISQFLEDKSGNSRPEELFPPRPQCFYSGRGIRQHVHHHPPDPRQSDCGDVAVDLGRDVASVTVGVNPTSSGLLLSVKMNPGVSGSYETTVRYRGESIKGGDITVLVLLPEQERAVAKNVENINSAYWFSSGTYFKVVLLKLNGKIMKNKEVYVYVSEKLIYMKEGYLKIFNHRVPGASFRICPAVNLAVQRSNHLVISQREAENYDTIVQSDKVLEIAATYYTILQSRTGGTHTFAEKRAFFYESLAKYHERMKHKHCRMAITVSRNNLLESSLQATKYFSTSNWARLLEVHFVDEVGIDEGGVRREFFEVLTRFMFDPSNGMFVPLDSDADPGCPVHPNHNPPPHIKPKHFKLAGCIVGKCLYESAMGTTYRQNLNAKLSTSLLAKMIGVEPHYSMLEKDAPKLWRLKIKKIIETDSIESFGEDLGEKLKFTHEEYDNVFKSREVELVAGGAEKIVTDENKMEYISALGNYLQTKRVSKQLEMFLEGVYTLIPDAYLAMWDEADLELLLCGVRNYDVEEMRENCTVELSTSRRFDVVLEWFWLAVTHMTQEDMSRLLQFCTGSSLLPPGGFKDLHPNLQLSWGRLEAGSLPVSHTCFNNLVLPDAKNYQELERVLLVAIREGGEGFLMA